MKTVIYYFSGTGNSLQVARDLADQLGETKIVPMADMLGKKEISEKKTRVGLVFPTYCWGMPRIVVEFVSRLRLGSDSPVFSFITCGGSIGATNRQLDRQLRELGMSLYCGFGVRMPGNYTPMYGGPTPEKMKKSLGRARSKVRDAVKVIRKNEVVPFDGGDLLGRVLARLMYRMFLKGLVKADRKFFADERCTGCGICAKVCPVANIKVPKKGTPEWLGNCEQCMACLQWCPEEAIQYGKKTAARRRYRHPAVALKDVLRRK